eukprot:Blabericola_migrator_1__10730@NODE_613_length_7277_cov_58_358391_g446_i0_p3_GENE_NODE_613_length_7277_cov_58_358391_g446_i0NODE_613_length_7277_cov_58_358391_g446_i0_p3_ORF_typecomplete_len316_score43_01_NODE_613_length_7277_cov_58_358391_g446_i046005547
MLMYENDDRYLEFYPDTDAASGGEGEISSYEVTSSSSSSSEEETPQDPSVIDPGSLHHLRARREQQTILSLLSSRLKIETTNEERSNRDAQLSARKLASTVPPTLGPLLTSSKGDFSEDQVRTMPRLLRASPTEAGDVPLSDRRSFTNKHPRQTLANLMSAIRDPAALSRDLDRGSPPEGTTDHSSRQYLAHGPSSGDIMTSQFTDYTHGFSVERELGDGRSRDTALPSEDDEVWSTLEEMALEGEIHGMHPDGNPMFYRFTSTAFQHVLADLLPAEERNHMAHLARIVVAIRKYYGLTFLINQVKQRERQARPK